ncbi:sugar transferase [Arthrobacter sp. MMS24-S77]
MKGYDSVKRLLDLVGAFFLCVGTLPLQVVVALMVLRCLGRPVLFRQERPGLHGEIFTVLKFRSMRTPDTNRERETDDDRLDSFGKFLRATSLDELPTLFNVLKGEMSFVGPRPLLVSYLPLYDDVQMRRHEVRPGITGLAQVRGRNHLSWSQKFELDVRYVDSRSFWVDVTVLARTVVTVLRREGITDRNGDSVAPFTVSGSAKPVPPVHHQSEGH